MLAAFLHDHVSNKLCSCATCWTTSYDMLDQQVAVSCEGVKFILLKFQVVACASSFISDILTYHCARAYQGFCISVVYCFKCRDTVVI